MEQEYQLLVDRICEIYEKISNLESLKPSEHVNTLFTQLVLTCIPTSPAVDVSKLPQHIQQMRSHLISLCGQAEGLLESHYSTLLGSFDNPLDHLALFPYYSNYLKLSLLEFNILNSTAGASSPPPAGPRLHRVAFVGSGPLPLTSICLASYHLTSTDFHNYDIDPLANSMAARLVASDPDLSTRMFFHTTDIMDVTSAELGTYDVVFLAALVGMNMEEKRRVIAHLAQHMALGAVLMVRSAHGARAFLYPVVDPDEDLVGFDVLSVFHPEDEVVNSVLIARKSFPHHLHQHHHQAAAAGAGVGLNMNPLVGSSIIPSSCKYCEFQAFNNNPLMSQMNMIEEIEEQIS